ncbi:MAG TPA: rhodanese-like domain-containing protein [Chromatiales bacterium]|nr:rhodanese-like domain-containing protein [Thiotrichales bacterium]HIP69656.1 rhodanese-like domain-containing protein [Chromatiales bacterium]
MQEYITFLQNHPLLISGFAAVLVLILWTELRRLNKGYSDLSPAETVQLMNREDVVLLDVREDSELGQGKIAGAKHIPLRNVAKRATELEKDKDKNIVAYCRIGNRSGVACNQLVKRGFEKVHNLKGGFTAWQSDNLPVSKK